MVIFLANRLAVNRLDICRLRPVAPFCDGVRGPGRSRSRHPRQAGDGASRTRGRQGPAAQLRKPLLLCLGTCRPPHGHFGDELGFPGQATAAVSTSQRRRPQVGGALPNVVVEVVTLGAVTGVVQEYGRSVREKVPWKSIVGSAPQIRRQGVAERQPARGGLHG